MNGCWARKRPRDREKKTHVNDTWNIEQKAEKVGQKMARGTSKTKSKPK